jgi:hypothetical protein
MLRTISSRIVQSPARSRLKVRMRLATATLTLLLSALSGCDRAEQGASATTSIAGSAAAAHGPTTAGNGGQPTAQGGTSNATSGTAGTSPAAGNAGAAQGGFPGVDLPEGKGWLELPDTKIRDVCACNDGFPEVCANSGCGGIFAWSSGAYDSQRSRLIVFGGGHSDYFGNELFALSLSDRLLKRITEPGLPLAPDCSASIADGSQPSSRHTYDTLLYLPDADRLFVFGGSMPPCGYLSQDTWTYSFADQAWEPHAPSGPIPEAVPGIVADYDPISKQVLLHDASALYRYDVAQDAFELLLDEDSIDYHMTGVVEPIARKLVLVGAGSVLTYDIDGDHARSELVTTGGDAIVGSGYPGLAYDSEGGKIVAWNGGDTAYELDLESRAWTALSSPNGPGDANETGTYKRWRYVPGQKSFVLVNGPNQNAYVFRR